MSGQRRIPVGQARPMRRRAAIMPGKRLDELVIAALAEARLPLGAYEIANRIRNDGHRVAMVSLYRSLDRLCADEKIEKIATLAAFRIKDVRQAMLTICVNCGATMPVAVPRQYVALEHALAESGFTVGRLTIEAAGLCAKCV